jgi:putative NADH-flavin reductase
MKRVALLGATGNLGRHVASQALAKGWALSVAVRNRARLSPDAASKAHIADLDLDRATVEEIAAFAAGHDVFVCCAGHVTQGDEFVRLEDKIVSALESIGIDKRPVCWFLAGAALLPLDVNGRLGLELPKVRDTYWPHKLNYERLQRSDLDWRLLRPGPMVEAPAIGLDRLRISLDALPAPLPAAAGALPALLVLPMFALKIPEMTIPYADAASVVLADVEANGESSRHRIGVALPVGMKLRK